MKVAIIDEPTPTALYFDELLNGKKKSSSSLSLEDLVNYFIKDKKVIDIKYAVGSRKSAMIMYEEEDYERK